MPEDSAQINSLAPEYRAKVLAVDDQRDALRLLQLRLQSAGLDCFPCSSGLAALQAVAKDSFDLIILDVMMPELDGYEICRRIKAEEKTKHIPVLFLTARNDLENKVRCLEAGGHDYLTKPVEQAELIARTRSALRVKQLQDQLKGQLELQQKINSLHQGMLGEHWQKTLGQLAASLAHEINNPLAAALGSVQLLTMEEGLDPAVLSRLMIIDKSLQRAGQKLRSLLLIAQSSRHPTSISLGQLLRDLLTVVNFQVVMNKITLQTRLDPTCYWQGHPNDLARALLYVINNAIEAVMDVPHPEVQVSVETDGKWHLINISDNGPGIPDQFKDEVFKPFFTTKLPPHNGVGLFLAREAIHSANGCIEVRKGPTGSGCSILIKLPASFEPPII
ncbi:MAG: response regulator [Verrucomicrobiales bacterium]